MTVGPTDNELCLIEDYSLLEAPAKSEKYRGTDRLFMATVFVKDANVLSFISSRRLYGCEAGILPSAVRFMAVRRKAS